MLNPLSFTRFHFFPPSLPSVPLVSPPHTPFFRALFCSMPWALGPPWPLLVCAGFLCASYPSFPACAPIYALLLCAAYRLPTMRPTSVLRFFPCSLFFTHPCPCASPLSACCAWSAGGLAMLLCLCLCLLSLCLLSGLFCLLCNFHSAFNVITPFQPQILLRLPCYDFRQVTRFYPNSPEVTGG